MPLPGYGGRIIKVNLSTKSIVIDETEKHMVRSFIGGKGLGTYLLLKYMKGRWETDPLSPENILVIAGGPFNGTVVPMASRVTLVFKSPLTRVYGESVVGGSFGAFMKWAGVDALIIVGRSPEPVYLLVSDDEVEIRNASRLWGKGIFETEDILREEHGKDSTRVLAIGQAGEKLVKFAAVGHEYYRQAGRCGGGAVMGSKNLKAIVIETGKRRVEYFDEDKLREIVSNLHKKIREHPSLKSYAARGTPGFVEKANVFGFFPTRYWHKVMFDKYDSINWESLSKYRVGRMTCFGCPVACHQYVEIEEPPYTGSKVTLEYETIFAIGGLCEIDDIRAIARLNMLMDDYGVDTISAGNVLAFAIEAYRRGKLPVDRELSYGDPESLEWLLEKIIGREGVGNILAEGVAKAAEMLDLKELAVHVKGLEPPGYDPRTLKGMILSYAVSPRGACHLRLMGYHADLLGLGGGRFSTSRDKVEVLVDLENKGIMYDSLPVCKFGRYVYDWDIMKDALNAVTGFNYTVGELKLTADRVRTLIRLFNNKLGIGRSADSLPRRFIEEPVEYEGRHYRVTGEEINRMLDTYYELRGWDSRGVPKKEILEKLKLSSTVSELGLN